VGQLLDGDPKHFAGKGVAKAVHNVKEIIAPALKGMSAYDQKAVDDKMMEVDGTPNKRNLGANAILSVSIAITNAAAASKKLPLYMYLGGVGNYKLPVPLFDILCGGAHAENSVDFQEYLMVPAGLSSYAEAVEAGTAVYKTLAKAIANKGYEVRGYLSRPLAAPLSSNREGFEVMAQAIEMAGYKLGEECFIGLDAATSELYENGKYVLKCEARSLTAAELADYWEELLKDFPIISIEDAMSEEDWDGWQAVTARIGDKVQLVGDDFFTTNPKRVKRGIESKCANAVLIKPNQVGSVSETLETIRLAHEAGWGAMPSSRSGETDQTIISDLAVLEACGQIKTGAPNAQSIIKHNQLLRIEDLMGDDAVYAGFGAFKTLRK
jgi:enolase